MATHKAWGGRFSEDLDEVASKFLASVEVDGALGEVDVQGSIAHATMLCSIGVLSAEERDAIVAGLTQIASEITNKTFVFDPAREDVHMNIEGALTDRIGVAGARLHTGRSRNDQVATDMRLWSRAACQRVGKRVDQLALALAQRAAGEVDVLMPAYTHLQRAQPSRLSHHLLAYVEMLDRDRGRLSDCEQRLNECPLGSGAVAGTTFALDREQTARDLGFSRPMRNSIDATGDRDFLLELLSALAIVATHLSRLSEELVLWSTQEFAFVEMADAHTTGSSMMPQKKNPDVAEVVRGKTGRVVGSLVALLVTLKGLPLGYNRDLQEDKPPVFDAVSQVDRCLEVLERVILAARFDAERMRRALDAGFVNATEAADYLVEKGVAFRDAHAVAGRLVARAIEAKTDLASLPLPVYLEEHPAFDQGIYSVLEPERAVERRDLLGAPAKRRVQAAAESAITRLTERLAR
ncbi:MAG: argininosuccinate lyase [Deltaproteobacteria bacterium]|nr:argininosuccinate lyase [Deltaproteobacteria bacterium]